jgi:hypothetical protein
MASNAALNELQAILDEEVPAQRKEPLRNRDAFVLCCLEGKPRADAASLLNCTEGTLAASRLAKSRELVQKRLTAGSVSLASALCAIAVSPAHSSAIVPATLGPRRRRCRLATVSYSAVGVVSPYVVAIAVGGIAALCSASTL